MRNKRFESYPLDPLNPRTDQSTAVKPLLTNQIGLTAVCVCHMWPMTAVQPLLTNHIG